MAEVWAHANAKGSELLMLLAIADHAADKTREAWPCVDTLATKTRMSKRQVRRLVDRLEGNGLLEIIRRVGLVHRYRVLELPIHNLGQDVQGAIVTTLDTGVHSTLDTAMSPEPSGNHQKNHHTDSVASRVPECPLPPEWKTFAVGLSLDADDAYCRFVDYWRGAPGRKGVKADWFATWRNWCRNDQGRPCRPRPVATPKKDYSAYNAAVKR